MAGSQLPSRRPWHGHVTTTTRPGAGAGSGSGGVFTVTVPAGFRDDVVWTLVNQERSFSVPGNAQSSAYQLQWPMALGSQPPLVRFSPDGPAGRGSHRDRRGADARVGGHAASPDGLDP